MKTREQQNWEKALQLHIYRLRNELLGIEGGNLAQVREPEAKDLRYRIAVAEADLAGLDAPPPPPVEDDLSETPVANGLAEGTDIDTVFVAVADRSIDVDDPTTSDEGPQDLLQDEDYWDELDRRLEADMEAYGYGINSASIPDDSETD